MSVSDGQVADVDFIPSIFMATTAEYLSGKSTAWLVFTSTVEHQKTHTCMLNQGFTPAEVKYIADTSYLSNVPPDNSQFPDVARLKSGSFAIPPPRKSKPGEKMGVNKGVPASQQAAFNASLQSCSKKSMATFASVQKLLTPLEELWGKKLDQLPSDPGVVASMKGWRACVAKGGVKVTTLDSFFGYVDHEIQTKNILPNSPEIQSLARLYGDCIEPVAKAMDAARLRYRQQILDTHAEQVRQVQQQMATLYRQLSAKYGVKTNLAS